MTKEELRKTEGVGLAKDEKGKAYLIVDGKMPEAEAMKYAKMYFKCAKSQLKIEIAKVVNGNLYPMDGSAKKSELVWQITREVAR